MGGRTVGSKLNHKTIVLNHDIYVRSYVKGGRLTNSIKFSTYSDITIDLNGHSIKLCFNNKVDEDIYNSTSEADKKNTVVAMITLDASDSTTTIIGDGVIDASCGIIPTYTFDIIRNNANLNIKGGTIIGGTSSVFVQTGILNIEGGRFDLSKEYKDVNNPKAVAAYLINAFDNNFNKTALINISGGEFVNFDPSKAPGETGKPSLLVNGYSVVSDDTTGEIIYKVIKNI